MSFRAFTWVMAGLFCFAALLQYNDPDPLRWMAVYTATAVVSIGVARRGRVAPLWPGLVGAVAGVWGVLLTVRVERLDTYTSMFDAWEMHSPSVEVAREATGLLLAASWMLVLVLRRATSPTTMAGDPDPSDVAGVPGARK